MTPFNPSQKPSAYIAVMPPSVPHSPIISRPLLRLLMVGTLLLLFWSLQAATYSSNTTVTGNVNDGMVINSGVTVTIDANITVTGGTIDIKPGATLIINAGRTLETDQDLVNDNGTLTINGTLNMTNGEKKLENKAGGTINGTGNIILAAGIDVFNNDGSDFFGYTGSNPTGPGGQCAGDTCSSSIFLPINLRNFDVKEDAGRVILTWTTETELNNDYFTVERSSNAKDWMEIRVVAGAGTSNQALSYSITDRKPVDGYNYYRLKQTDFDGSYTYFEVRAVSIERNEPGPVVAYPTPTKGQIFVQSTALESSTTRLFNLCGQDVSHLVRWSSGLGTGIEIDMTTLPAGLYLLKTPDSTIRISKQ